MQQHPDSDGPLATVTRASTTTTTTSSSARRRNLLTRSGGTYIPPAKLAALLEAESAAALASQSPVERATHTQRLSWETLRKSINGLINKLSINNIKDIIPQLIGQVNVIRGRGLFCRAVMKAQSASLPYTPIYAALVAVLNTKFPQIGELLIMRLVAQWRRGYKRMDKTVCLSVVTFLAHLINQKVVNDFLALEIITLLLTKPTDDSVEITVGFVKQIGQHFAIESPKAMVAIFDRLRAILHEGSNIHKRTMYMVEVLFQIRKEGFKDYPAIPEGLDLVEESDQLTHSISMTDKLNTQDLLNVFVFDPDYDENVQMYQAMKKEILGLDSDEEEGEGGDHGSDDDTSADGRVNGEQDRSQEEEAAMEEAHQKMIIQDQTNTNLINLRRAIYLTIMSSLNFEECAHKLLKLDIAPGQEQELINMIVECCSQEKTFVSFYGFLAERFAKLNRKWTMAFETAFEELYKTIHRFETNRLRNIANLFAYLLSSNAISWKVWALVSITEADTTSSSRIFLKILLQKLVESMGLAKLKERMCTDPKEALKNMDKRHFGGGQRMNDMIITISTPQGYVNQGVFEGCFPRDDPKNTRFAINYFTSIGLGSLTEALREHLKLMMAKRLEEEAADQDSSSEEEDYSDAASEYSSASFNLRADKREVNRGPPASGGVAAVHSERAHLLSKASVSPPYARERRHRPLSPREFRQQRRRGSLSASPSPPPTDRRPRSLSRSPSRVHPSDRRRDKSISPYTARRMLTEGKLPAPPRGPPTRTDRRTVSPVSPYYTDRKPPFHSRSRTPVRRGHRSRSRSVRRTELDRRRSRSRSFSRSVSPRARRGTHRRSMSRSPLEYPFERERRHLNVGRSPLPYRSRHRRSVSRSPSRSPVPNTRHRLSSVSPSHESRHRRSDLSHPQTRSASRSRSPISRTRYRRPSMSHSRSPTSSERAILSPNNSTPLKSPISPMILKSAVSPKSPSSPSRPRLDRKRVRSPSPDAVGSRGRD